MVVGVDTTQVSIVRSDDDDDTTMMPSSSTTTSVYLRGRATEVKKNTVAMAPVQSSPAQTPAGKTSTNDYRISPLGGAVAVDRHCRSYLKLLVSAWNVGFEFLYGIALVFPRLLAILLPFVGRGIRLN